MANVADNPELEPPKSPGAEQATDQGPDGPFFDPDNLDLSIADIDLAPLSIVKGWDFKTSDDQAETTKKVIWFLTSAVSGFMEKEEFEHIYPLVLGEMMTQILTTDGLNDLYDEVEPKHPRVTELLIRVRESELFSSDNHKAITKLILLFTKQRDTAHS